MDIDNIADQIISLHDDAYIIYKSQVEAICSRNASEDEVAHLLDNMFGFCHRKRGEHDCAEARSCGGEGCPISKEMREAGLISLRRMKEGQKARIAHWQASGELGRRIRDMGLIPGAEVEVVGRAPLRDPVALRLPGFTLSLRNNEADYIVVEPLEQAG